MIQRKRFDCKCKQKVYSWIDNDCKLSLINENWSTHNCKYVKEGVQK